jgi:DNA-binding MarR family transcriptional regulator
LAAPVETQDSQVPAADSYEAFWLALDEFVRALNHVRGRAAAGTPPDELTIPQYKLLEAVVGSDSPRSGEIALELGVSAPTVTRMITALESADLIRRLDASEDRRAVRIELTSKGQEARRRTRRRLEAKRRRLFAALPAEDRENAVRVLRSLAGGMDAL